MTPADTIVAVSSAGGHAVRAVVRMSGSQALPCAAARFVPYDAAAAWGRGFRATPGELRLLADPVRVPALAYVMRAPRSYTREDVVEFHLPGAPALLELVLEDLIGRGPGCLRLAEPGEFTRRAYLNGRIDLTQAEAVLAVIRAGGEAGLLAAQAPLGGSVRRLCARMQRDLGELRARVEAALDFAEHGIELIGRSELEARLVGLLRRVRSAVGRGRGELAADGGVRAVLCGAPNAGKSSLLNQLARREAALVTPVPGTTRDAVRAEAELSGVRFTLTDTAGLTAGARGVDAEAVERARQLVRTAHLVIFVVDGSTTLPDRLADALALAPPHRGLLVVNKCDRAGELPEAELQSLAAGRPIVHASALTGEGIDEVEEALWRTVTQGRVDGSAADCALNARQRSALRRAEEELARARQATVDGFGYELVAVSMREASDALGDVVGELTPQDVLDGIFARFCVGK